MTRRIILSPQAWHDLASIEEYTRHTWGAAQSRAYIGTLNEAFQLLASYPHIGHTRSFRTYRAYQVGAHIAIYRHSDSQIEILNIFHTSMDVNARLNQARKPTKPRQKR